jgi:hypothetical protein
MADEASVFITIVFLAPQPAGLSQGRVTEKTLGNRKLMLGATLFLLRGSQLGLSRER